MTSAIEARLDADKLIEQACELAGSDDFGDDDGWRGNLDRLLEVSSPKPTCRRSAWRSPPRM